MNLSRNKKIVLWSVAVVLAIPVICIVLLLTFDWNRARPWIGTRVGNAIGRTFEIKGDLSVHWKKSQGDEHGWRAIVPWPQVRAQDVVLGNPDWARTGPLMATLKQVDFSLNPLALLQKKIVVPSLTLASPELELERLADGHNNWTFKSSATASPWQWDVRQLHFNEGDVHLLDSVKKIDLSAAIETLDEEAAAVYGFTWAARGTFNGEPVSGNGKAGPILSLKTQAEPYPIEADVKVGKTDIKAVGTLTKPSDLAAVDMRLKLSGASMAHLYKLIRIVLPETPPYTTEGHLLGNIGAHGGGNWVYEKFRGKVGSSDLAGTLEYQSKEPRGLIKGAVVSNLLVFSDLAPLIGADSNASKRERGAATVQPADKVLPIEPFKTDRWRVIDADVKFTAHKIVRDKSLPIDNLTTNLHLDDGVLSLLPLNFGVAGGNLKSDIRLDGREKIIKAEMTVAARNLRLKQLIPALKLLDASLGKVDGNAKLSGTGNSIAAMLGSSNGQVKALIDHGTVSKLLLEETGLNIGNIVLTKLTGDKQVKLNCLAADFAVSAGLMNAQTFVVDAETAVLHFDGDISLANEQLDLTITQKTKGLRLVSLRAPIYITGSFLHPRISPDKKVLALKAVGAATLAAVAPVAALLPLVNTGKQEQASECPQSMREARKAPVAPAPGKTYRMHRKVVKK